MHDIEARLEEQRLNMKLLMDKSARVLELEKQLVADNAKKKI